MRKLNYKIAYNQRWPIFRNLKLLRFNRRKWFFIKRIIIQEGLGLTNAKDLSFTPLFNNNKELPLVIRKKLLYKNKMLLLKRLRFNDISLKRYQLKSLLVKKKKYSGLSKYFLFNLSSRLDFILYKTFAFSSLSSLNQFLLHGGIFVNGKVCLNGNLFLKEGDLVSFDKKKNCYKKLFINLFMYRSNKVFDVIEFDFNLMSFIVKDLNPSNAFFKNFYPTYYKDFFWAGRAF